MFISDFENYGNNFQHIKKYNNDWKIKFPFLNKFRLTYKDDDFLKWEYKYKTDNIHLTIDIFKDKLWSIEVEEIKNDIEDSITFEYINIYNKYSLSYSDFLNEISYLNKRFNKLFTKKHFNK